MVRTTHDEPAENYASEILRVLETWWSNSRGSTYGRADRPRGNCWTLLKIAFTMEPFGFHRKDSQTYERKKSVPRHPSPCRALRAPDNGLSSLMPSPLPSDPPVSLTGDLQRLLSEADRALGRLDGSIQTLPNPDLFVYMYVRKEAVLSSQIEGTQSSLQDLLAAEA